MLASPDRWWNGYNKKKRQEYGKGRLGYTDIIDPSNNDLFNDCDYNDYKGRLRWTVNAARVVEEAAVNDVSNRREQKLTVGDRSHGLNLLQDRDSHSYDSEQVKRDLRNAVSSIHNIIWKRGFIIKCVKLIKFVLKFIKFSYLIGILAFIIDMS